MRQDDAAKQSQEYRGTSGDSHVRAVQIILHVVETIGRLVHVSTEQCQGAQLVQPKGNLC